MFGSLRGSTANKSKTYAPPAVPSAFPTKKNNFAPPPVRTASVQARDEEQEEEQVEEETQGEWAEAIYDYDSKVRLLSCLTSQPHNFLCRILEIYRYGRISTYWFWTKTQMIGT